MSTEPTIREICEEFRRLEERKKSNVFYYASFRDHCIKTFPALVAEVERLQRENDELKKSYRREQTNGDSKITDFVRPSLMGVTVYPEATVVLVEYGDNNTEVWEFPTNAALQKRVEELEKKRNKKYVVVTVTEGGADFSEYEDPGQLTSQWLSRDQLEEVRSELCESEIGDVVTIDGCGTCFIVNATDAHAQKGEQ